MQAFDSKVEICNIVLELKEVFDNVQLPGQYTFPFEVMLPDWLPASMLITNVSDRMRSQVRYEVRAQWIPTENDGWADEAKITSKLRCKRSCFFSRAPQEFPVVDFQKELKMEIGGVFGLGAQKCTTTIHLEKNEFLAGEKVPVKIVCDNTKCDKAVKSFKFKLFRRYQCINFETRQVSHGATQLFNNKEPGIAAKNSIDKVFEV